jgi:hypothetical protein
MVYMVYGSARRPLSGGRKARASESMRSKIMRELRGRARSAPTAMSVMDPEFLRRAVKDSSIAPSTASGWPAPEEVPQSWLDRAGTFLLSLRGGRGH